MYSVYGSPKSTKARRIGVILDSKYRPADTIHLAPFDVAAYDGVDVCLWGLMVSET